MKTSGLVSTTVRNSWLDVIAYMFAVLGNKIIKLIRL